MTKIHTQNELPDEKLFVSVFNKAIEAQDPNDKSGFLIKEKYGF